MLSLQFPSDFQVVPNDAWALSAQLTNSQSCKSGHGRRKWWLAESTCNSISENFLTTPNRALLKTIIPWVYIILPVLGGLGYLNTNHQCQSISHIYQSIHNLPWISRPTVATVPLSENPRENSWVSAQSAQSTFCFRNSFLAFGRPALHATESPSIPTEKAKIWDWRSCLWSSDYIVVPCEKAAYFQAK